jgi:hypothetical protein
MILRRENLLRLEGVDAPGGKDTEYTIFHNGNGVRGLAGIPIALMEYFYNQPRPFVVKRTRQPEGYHAQVVYTPGTYNGCMMYLDEQQTLAQGRADEREAKAQLRDPREVRFMTRLLDEARERQKHG